MREVPDGLDLAPPYEGPARDARVITPQYTGDDIRKGREPHQGYRRWRDLPPEERVRMSVVTCVVQLWNQQGKLPTAARIAAYKKLDQQRVAEALANPETVNDLRRHGIINDEANTWEEAVNGERAGLTKRQIDAVREYFARTAPEDDRTLSQALADADTTPTEWNAWLQDPVFRNYVYDLGRSVYDQTELDIALQREATKGDVPALRLAMEVTGRIKTDKHQVNSEMLIARLLEAVQRHAPLDAQAAIAEDIGAMVQAMRSNALPSPAPKVIEVSANEPVQAEVERGS